MKNISKKNMIIMVLIAVIIIAGIIVTATKGFQFDLRYQDTKKIELYLKKDFEISDIRQIINEVMPGQNVLIQKVEVYKDSVSITSNEINDEQKENIIQKVNEKYGTELTADATEISNIPNTRGRDLIKPYIVPFIITTLIILVYMAIRYYKLSVVKVLVQTILMSTVSQLVLLSVISIARIPVGRLTIPMIIIVYLLTLVGITTNLERKLKIKREQEAKEKK